MIKNIANTLTALRIVCSCLLLFVRPFENRFYILYITAGITDMIDGFVARKCNRASNFGAAFDTAADFIFVICAMVKILPLFEIPFWLYVWLAVIFIIKSIAVLMGHTHALANKFTGFLLSVFPFLLNVIDFYFGTVLLLIIATITAIFDIFYIKRDGRNSDEI